MPVATEDRATVPAPEGPARPSARWVRDAALALVAAQVLVRWWLVAGRDWYGDDLRMLHLADVGSLLSPSYLATDYDGHFMPGAFLLAGVVERLGPLEWWAATLVLVVLQLLASLALWRLLRVLLGDRPLLLVPLAVGLFTPLTLGSLTWWAASLNSLPLQIGLACFLAEAVQLVRTGSRWYALRAALVYAGTLLFYLKALLLPWIGVGVVAVVLVTEGTRWPVVAALRRGWLLWTAALAVTGAWAAVYLGTRTDPPVSAGGTDDVVRTVRTGFRVLAAAVSGGPTEWDTFPGATPLAVLQPGVVRAGALVVLAAALWTCARRRGAVLLWLLALGTCAAGLVMAAAGRGSLGLGEVLPLAGRYYPVESVLLPAAGAMLAVLPLRGRRGTAVAGTDRGPVRPPVRRAATAVAWTAATAVFVVNALTATVSHGRAWEDDRTGAWLAAARVSLAAAGPAPLLDQPAPADVLGPDFHPHHVLSHALSPLEDRPPFAAWTTELRMLDDAGVLRPAEVEPVVTVVPGPVPVCGWSVVPGAPTAVALDGPVPDAEWTARFGYVADRDGTVAVGLPAGDPVRAPVGEGVGVLYLRLTGGGGELLVAVQTPGLRLCVGAGVVGDAVLR
ncbi:hypothetical protein [Blastococcus sp. SYSU D00813]